MNRPTFTAITSEGGLLPADFLQSLLAPKTSVDGLTAKDYHLAEGERINDQVNRSWNRLRGCWENFKKAIATKAAGDSTTSETRERWLLPLFQELGFGRLPNVRSIALDGRTYEISHQWESVPIHLVGTHVDLDRRTPGATGASRGSPHSLVQQFINADKRCLWGIVTNGLVLRLLRDNAALTRQAFVECDLQAIFDGDLYAEFFVLWLVAHQSRFETPEPGRPEKCWLERWSEAADQTGLRALDQLRPGVEAAIQALGEGLYTHPQNTQLRAKLATGDLKTEELYRQILRLIYRMIFLFVAEERGLLHPEDDSDTARRARQRYAAYYSLTRLRDLTLSLAGTPHPDLWKVFQFVTEKLGSDTGCPDLALPALGSFLWSAAATADLNACLISNRQVLTAVHALVFVKDGNVRRAVDYRHLGAEELGSVYESLLELHVEVNPVTKTFRLNTVAGNERKTSSSYYSPDSLVQCLLDSALDPVMAEAVKGKSGEDAAKALLALKICDPAVGSGHFLIAAAHRLAKRVAAARSGEEEPSPQSTRIALREVIGRCLYGVDINPMSAELCRVSLWLEALVPGKTLSFLDHHIRVGNSLIGATPELISRGIPDGAFEPIEGDDKKACSTLKKRNKAEREGFGELFAAEDNANLNSLRSAAIALGRIDDGTPNSVRCKESAFIESRKSDRYIRAKGIADTWCAAFFIRKQFYGAVHEGIARGISQVHLNDQAYGRTLLADLAPDVERLSAEYLFFHWYLEFPDVFMDGGFDVVLGNPPWDEVQFEETSWFASRDTAIAGAKNASEREGLIAELEKKASPLFERYRQAVRRVEATKIFVRNSGLYPTGAFGKLNTYVLFVEESSRLVKGENGRLGCIVPTGIATDKSTSTLFGALMSTGRLRSLYDFVNQRLLFPAIRPHQHFCLLTVGSMRNEEAPADIASFLVDIKSLYEQDHRYTLSWTEVVALNPEAQTLSLFPTRWHADATRKLVSCFPSLGSQTSVELWGAEYQQGTFNTASASELFRTTEELALDGFEIDGLVARRSDDRYVPLFDAKLARQYEWRAANLSFSGNQFRKVAKVATSESDLCDPSFLPNFAYWVPSHEANSRLGAWPHNWILGFKDVTGVTSTRLAAFALFPRMGVGDVFPLLKLSHGAEEHAFVCAWLNSLLVELFLRQRMQGLHLTWHILMQVPTPTRQQSLSVCPWDDVYSIARWFALRVAELSVTSWPLVSFCQQLGLSALPFKYDAGRRILLRAEVDAGLFILAGYSYQHVEVALDMLEKVRARDHRDFGEYRTKRLILDIYDALATAIRTGQPYQTRLDPPPADPRCCHSPRQVPVPAPTWMDRPLVMPTTPRGQTTPDRYRSIVVPHLLYQAGGRVSFDRFRKAFWLLTEPKTLQRYAQDAVGPIAAAWGQSFRDTLEKDKFIPHLKGAVLRQLHFIRVEGERWLELRDTTGIADDEHAVFDARLALHVADLWPTTEPIPALTAMEEAAIRECELVT